MRILVSILIMYSIEGYKDLMTTLGTAIWKIKNHELYCTLNYIPPEC